MVLFSHRLDLMTPEVFFSIIDPVIVGSFLLQVGTCMWDLEGTRGPWGCEKWPLCQELGYVTGCRHIWSE